LSFFMSVPLSTKHEATPFEEFDETLRSSGPGAAVDGLIDVLTERGEFRALLDAMLLKARHDLGLPLVQVGSLADLPDPARTQYEERYVEAIRTVGHRLLANGDIVAAWPYFRAIAEKEPVATAIESYEPDEGDERVGAIVDVAFNQGAHPRKGFQLILDHFGPCSAISAFDHLPADDAMRVPSADLLIRHLHAQLTASLRIDIGRRGQPLPPEGASIRDLITNRDWLFVDDAYHLDVSHLASGVRISPVLTDPETIKLAIELTDYGRKLSERHRYEGDPPFERVYEDHAVYLRALVGEDIDGAIAHFLGKIPKPSAESPADLSDSIPAQTLVRLLDRLGRIEQAIEVAADHLADLPDSVLFCPSVAQLCQRAGLPDRLAQVAREHGDLVNYAAAVLQTLPPPT
jgi:hypothetical protein